MSIDLTFLLDRYLDYYPFLIPLGVIGTWRWSIWLTKKIISVFYKPQNPGFKASVSVVTPVYNEDPKIFNRALESWKKNSPKEIIAVIDYTDKACIQTFKKFAKKNLSARLIITKTPGKRPALADGIRSAKSDIVALVDSDTIWQSKVITNALSPFKDKKVAGVATRQSVENPRTLAQKLFSIRLEQRFWDEIPFLAVVEDVLVCLSGRTAFYRREALLLVLNDMVNETFMGKKVISGEDKRLTYLVQAAGWKTAYQSTARVFTPGEKAIPTFLKQQVRWTRNSWRAELKAFRDGWIFKHHVFTLYTIDRMIQPFTLLISPIYFLVSLFFGLWLPVFVILGWWFVSRGVKMYPHLRRKPLDILILPVFILFNFVTAYIRIYSLFTLNLQGWLTRWHRARLPTFPFSRIVWAHVGTLFVTVGIIGSILSYKQYTYVAGVSERNRAVARALPTVTYLASAKVSNVLGATTVNENQLLLAKKYITQPTDSLGGVAEKFGINSNDMLLANVSKITNWTRIDPGMLLTIPPQGLNLSPKHTFNFQRIYPDFLRIYYDSAIDTIVVEGRGKQINLATIQSVVGEKYLRKVAPKVWYLTSNLYIRSGVTFHLDKKEVSWLRLESNKNKFVSIRAFNGTIIINGVKITSWDEKKNNYDKEHIDGRSYILVKDGSRMDITNSELAYLGYSRPQNLPFSPYGVSWKMSTGKLGTTILTGEVIGSKFHHNYFGAYTFGATGMTWRGNEFYSNVRYGLDPHDDSNGFLVESNKFYNNGTHGLIFSKRVLNNIVRNNESFNNKGHGIMLHEGSNSNLVEKNKIWGNTAGVAIDHSSKNIVRNNWIFENKHGVRAHRNSKENLIEANRITDNKEYGVYLYDNSDGNLIRQNILARNANGMYIKTKNNELSGNFIAKNKVGVYLLGPASKNKLLDNQIANNRLYGIYTKVSSELSNLLGQNNQVLRNKRDTSVYYPN